MLVLHVQSIEISSAWRPRVRSALAPSFRTCRAEPAQAKPCRPLPSRPKRLPAGGWADPKRPGRRSSRRDPRQGVPSRGAYTTASARALHRRGDRQGTSRSAAASAPTESPAVNNREMCCASLGRVMFSRLAPGFRAPRSPRWRPPPHPAPGRECSTRATSPERRTRRCRRSRWSRCS